MYVYARSHPKDRRVIGCHLLYKQKRRNTKINRSLIEYLSETPSFLGRSNKIYMSMHLCDELIYKYHIDHKINVHKSNYMNCILSNTSFPFFFSQRKSEYIKIENILIDVFAIH